MPRLGLDYTGGLSGSQVRASGRNFVARYLSHTPSKNITRGEYENLRSAGVDVILVWETTARRALDGHAAGAADAADAAAQYRALGAPAGRPIYFAVDFDATPGEQAAINEYLRGAASQLGLERVGVYGSFYVVNRAQAAGVARYFWQTYAWSGGQLSRHANVYQYSNGHVVAGHGVDFDKALTTDFGQLGFEKPQPRPPEKKNLRGKLKFEGTLDADTGHWEIRGLPSENVQMGEHDRRWEASISVGERRGDWQVHSQPFSK